MLISSISPAPATPDVLPSPHEPIAAVGIASAGVAQLTPIGAEHPMAAGGIPPGVDPVEIPQTLGQLGELVSRAYDLSVTGAASLSIPIAGSISGSTSRRVVIFEWTRFKQLSGDGGLQYQYGYVIRFCVTVSKWDAGAKLSLPWVAAQAQVGNIEASWMMQIRGLTGPKLDAVVLPPQELNVETFVIAKQSLQQAIAVVTDPTTTFIPGTLLATVDPTAPEVRLWLDAIRALAVSDIQRGKSRDQCQAHLRSTDTAALDAVGEVYADFGLTDGTANPNQAQRDRAKALLHGLSTDVH